MPDDRHSKPRPQSFPRIFDESETVVDPAFENLSNGSLKVHPEVEGSRPDGPSEGSEPPE